MNANLQFKLWQVVIVSVLLISLGGGVAAQGPTPSQPTPSLRESRVGTSLQTLMGTAITYQGQLRNASGPVNGACDFAFSLWDSLGNLIGRVGITQTKTLTVTNGLFIVSDLDFGAGVFTGEARWLEVAVRCPAGSGSYATLSPRQALTPVPYALALPGLWTRQNATSPNLIGGYSGNSVADGVYGATIGGGGASGYPNQVTANYATVGGGATNTAGGPYAVVSGGYQNTANGYTAVVGGGSANQATTDATIAGGVLNSAGGWRSAIGGGYNNTSADYATVGGGKDNAAGGTYATLGGGASNTASGDTATISGGALNTASGWDATIGGGRGNIANSWKATVGGGDTNRASGEYATVPGGISNEAIGAHSFAAGRRAKANHDGAFVWADSTDADFASTSEDQFAVRATQGAYFWSNNDGYALMATNVATRGATIGIYGRADSSDYIASGVYGHAASASDYTYGVRGQSDSTSGRGVWGYAGAASGSTIGVVGVSASTSGIGVRGAAPATSGATYGVYGISYSTGGYGVYGTAPTTGTVGVGTGANGYGVVGQTLGSSGWGGYFTSEGNGGVALAAEGHTSTGDVFRVYGASEGDVEFRVTGSGEVYADGNYHSGGADLAEMLPATDNLEPSDVLVIGPDGKLTRSSQPYQPTVAGVYSTRPGFLGGAGDGANLTGQIPLAVVGVVPVRASAENGSIRPGDLLVTSSTPGHAMKAGTNPAAGTVLGKALEELNTGTGIIKILVMLQ